MTYSLEFREKVLAVKAQEKLTIAETAKRFQIGSASIAVWVKNLEPKKSKNRPQLKLDLSILKKDIQRYPNASQLERAKRLGVSQVSVGYALRKLNVKYLRLGSNIIKMKHKQKFCLLPCFSTAP